MLGDDEWYSDGLVVGMEEGSVDGALLSDGDNVGYTLGCEEGNADSLGNSLGISDDDVGEVVGNVEGIPECARDGPSEGFTLGPSDGALVLVCDGLLVEMLSWTCVEIGRLV